MAIKGTIFSVTSPTRFTPPNTTIDTTIITPITLTIGGILIVSRV